MNNIDKQAVTAKTKELASLMVERFSMNPVSCKLLNESWEKEFPDEVAIAKRMLALLDELEAADKKTVEMPSFDGYVPHIARELQAAFRIACDNAGINVSAGTDEGDRT